MGTTVGRTNTGCVGGTTCPPYLLSPRVHDGLRDRTRGMSPFRPARQRTLFPNRGVARSDSERKHADCRDPGSVLYCQRLWCATTRVSTFGSGPSTQCSMATNIVPSTPPRGPELVFGLVGAIGTNLDLVARLLSDALDGVSYEAQVVRLSSLLTRLPQYENLRQSPLGKL